MRMLKLAGFLWVSFLLTSFAAPATMADDTQDIRQVITMQLEAFKRDDGVEAYSYAAPVIKEIFPTPDEFISGAAGISSGLSSA